VVWNSIKRAVSILATSPLAHPFGTPVFRLTQYALSLHRREVVNFDQRPDRARTAEFIRGVLTMFQPMTMGVDEGFMIYSAAQRTAKLPGDIAEVGVFRGQSARIICEVKRAGRCTSSTRSRGCRTRNRRYRLQKR
jgi:hypothetical protein